MHHAFSRQSLRKEFDRQKKENEKTKAGIKPVSTGAINSAAVVIMWKGIF